MKDLFQSFIAKRLANKLKGYSASEVLRFYGSMRERVYAHLTAFLLGLYALLTYTYTYGVTQWGLLLLLVFILVCLFASVVYHLGVVGQVKDYLVLRLKPILHESERPENYFKGKISTGGISIVSSKIESVEVNSEPSEGSSE